MYMRNRKYDNYALNEFPPNYSGQHSREEIKHAEHIPEPELKAPPKEEKHEAREEKKSLLGSIGSIFGSKEGGEKKGGLLSGLFNNKDGGILSGIELEDIILLAVIFFLLKDNFEDDLIIILALILLSG